MDIDTINSNSVEEENIPKQIEVNTKGSGLPKDLYIFKELTRGDEKRIAAVIAPFFFRDATLTVSSLSEIFTDPNFIDAVISSYMRISIEEYNELSISLTKELLNAFHTVNPVFFSTQLDALIQISLSIQDQESKVLSTLLDENLFPEKIDLPEPQLPA